jgi:hypothetical protein
MGAKYIGSSPGANERLGGPGCDSAGYVGMVIEDTIAMACWSITGLKVKIEGTTMGFHEGFEVINFNFSQSTTQPAVPTIAGLPGLYGSSSIGVA